MTGRRLTGAVLTIAGAAGGTVCLASASGGFRDVMQTDGGFCGPYASVSQCSAGDLRMISIGVVGGLVAAAIYAFGTRALGRSASSAGLVIWVALFGALGWNFISLGLRPAAEAGASSGWLVTGGMFWLMAFGGLIPLLAGLAGGLRPGARGEPTYLGPSGVAYFGPREVAYLGTRSLVRGGAGSLVRGGAGSLARGGAGTVARGGAGWIGMWVIGSLAGTGLGLAATSGLIGALR